ncbi:MAG TPA: hypothetical protein VF610_12780 [Segetibacter sp.]|jgi:hypothetical protein
MWIKDLLMNEMRRNDDPSGLLQLVPKNAIATSTIYIFPKPVC